MRHIPLLSHLFSLGNWGLEKLAYLAKVTQLIHGWSWVINLVPGDSDSKSICLQCERPGFEPWFGKIPWRRKWQSTPVLLPGKSHGQRSLAGCSLWGHKESDMTERLQFTSLWILRVWYGTWYKISTINTWMNDSQLCGSISWPVVCWESFSKQDEGSKINQS